MVWFLFAQLLKKNLLVGVGGGGGQEQTQRHLRARWDKTVAMDFQWSRDEGVVNICEQQLSQADTQIVSFRFARAVHLKLCEGSWDAC